MTRATKPATLRKRKARTIIRWDIYLIAPNGTEREFARDLDELAKGVYLESVSRRHCSDERVEARPVVYKAIASAKAPAVASQRGKIICGPNGALNLKELQREDRERLRQKDRELRDLIKAARKGGAE